MVQAGDTSSIKTTFKGVSILDHVEIGIIKPTTIIMETHVGHNVFVQ